MVFKMNRIVVGLGFYITFNSTEQLKKLKAECQGQGLILFYDRISSTGFVTKKGYYKKYSPDHTMMEIPNFAENTNIFTEIFPELKPKFQIFTYTSNSEQLSSRNLSYVEFISSKQKDMFEPLLYELCKDYEIDSINLPKYILNSIIQIGDIKTSITEIQIFPFLADYKDPFVTPEYSINENLYWRLFKKQLHLIYSSRDACLVIKIISIRIRDNFVIGASNVISYLSQVADKTDNKLLNNISIRAHYKNKIIMPIFRNQIPLTKLHGEIVRKFHYINDLKTSNKTGLIICLHLAGTSNENISNMLSTPINKINIIIDTFKISNNVDDVTKINMVNLAKIYGYYYKNK